MRGDEAATALAGTEPSIERDGEASAPGPVRARVVPAEEAAGPYMPQNGIVRLVVVSDTHMQHRALGPLPLGDVLVHGGDFLTARFVAGHAECARDFAAYIREQPHPYKIVLGGNHDITADEPFYRAEWRRFGGNHAASAPWERAPEGQVIHETAEVDALAAAEAVRASLTGADGAGLGPGAVLALRAGAASTGWAAAEDLLPGAGPLPGGLRVYASPHTPQWVKPGAFQHPRGGSFLKEAWARVPPVDVLITHGPPHGIRDGTINGSHDGCELLRAEVTGRIKPAVHLFGHIHEGWGVEVHGSTLFVNAASCNTKQLIANPAVVVDVDVDIARVA